METLILYLLFYVYGGILFGVMLGIGVTIKEYLSPTILLTPDDLFEMTPVDLGFVAAILVSVPFYNIFMMYQMMTGDCHE